MPAARQRFAAIAAVAATAFLPGCGDEPLPAATKQVLATQRTVGYQLFWVGPSFEGHRLTTVVRDAHRTTIGYGTCDPPDGEGGCPPPLRVQTSSICDDNALALDIMPRASFSARGTTVRDYGEGRLALDAATSHVRVLAEGARGRRAIAALRPVSKSPRVTARLPPARLPNHYLAQLRRVRDAHARGGSLRAVRDELGISVSAARFQLALARDLGPAGLRSGVPCGHPPG